MISATTAAILLFIGCLTILPNSRSEKCSDLFYSKDSNELVFQQDSTQSNKLTDGDSTICAGSSSTVDIDM